MDHRRSVQLTLSRRGAPLWGVGVRQTGEEVLEDSKVCLAGVVGQRR